MDLSSHALRLLILTSALALAFHAQTPVARAGDCDEGIDADLFQDFGKEKDEKKPKHRLIQAPCDGCQWFLDALQKALDDCNNKKFKDAKDKKATVTGSNTTGSAMQDAWIAVQANAQMDEASDALEGEPKDPPKARSPKDLKDEVDKKWKELKGKLASCHARWGEPAEGSWLQRRRLAQKLHTPTPTPTPTPSRPRNITYTGPPPTPTPTPQEHGMAPRQPGKTGETCAVLIATGKIKVETSGTGETIGHIADLKIRSLTDRPLKFAILPMILESGSGKNQHYTCPIGQTVALNPHQTKTVPMNGVCLNRNKPPVAKGVSGDLVMNEANPSGPQNPNSHLPPADAGKLLRICTSKYDAADKLQKDGALKALPYKDKQKQKDIVVQWSTWTDPQICQIVGTTPATKDDLKKVVYKQLESKKPMSPDTKKKVDQGIDTIFEKVELTTAKAKDLEKPAEEGQGENPLSQPTQRSAQPSDGDFRDPNAHFDGDEISQVSQMKGSSFFFRLSDSEPVLIKISDLELVKDASGFIGLGKLVGQRVWGSQRFSEFNIDNSAEYQKRGLTKVSSLDGLNAGIPGSSNQVHFEKIQFRRLMTNGYSMLVITEIQGTNLATNQPLSGKLSMPDIVERFVCPSVFDWECWNTACSGYGCNLPACSCNGTGFCNWVIVGTKCINTNCAGTCRNPLGWSSFCPCL